MFLLEQKEYIWNIFLCYLILSNFLCLWAPFCRLQDCGSSLARCVTLGCRVGSGSYVGFLVGGARYLPAHWWLELDLVPLVGRAMSRHVRGSWLKTTLGSLSVNGWGCVPTLLVVGLRYFFVQAVGWGQISGPNGDLQEGSH